MTWPFAERAKVIHRGDEALAKEVMPNAVHHHPGQEGIGRIEDALGQLEAPTTFPHRGLVRSGQRFEKAARHLLPQLCGLASDEDLLIDAGALALVPHLLVDLLDEVAQQGRPDRVQA